ncbi:MAG TPA: GGDEF domain-containing protein, partial [Firmicutes bacterium]|nr:GGDEF domain-containing protein [Bacillota bacterium]
AWIRDAKSPVKSYIGVPIIIGDKVVAIINIDSWKPNKFTQSDVRIAETLARFAEVVMEKHSLFERLDALKKEAEELAIKDYLTGLYNRRELERMLSYEISKSIRYDSSFQLMMIDLDEFKSINDAFGHPEGDRVLKKFAEILRESVRKTDLVFRYGGDEFIVFVPGDDKMAVEKISKRIRDRFNKEFKIYIEELSFDFSFGHLVFPKDVGEVKKESEGVKLALKRVDEFLYYRKRRET